MFTKKIGGVAPTVLGKESVAEIAEGLMIDVALHGDGIDMAFADGSILSVLAAGDTPPQSHAGALKSGRDGPTEKDKDRT